jgi:hypothetical protein
MASNSVNRGVDENNRVSNVFPWICWRENHSKQRIEIVD